MSASTLQEVNRFNKASFMPKEEEPDVFASFNEKPATEKKKSKDVLVEVNKFNKFAFGGAAGNSSSLARWDRLASQEYGANYGDEGFTMDDYMNSKNKLGISKKNNPFSKGNIGGTMKGLATSLAPIAQNIGRSEENPNGLFDLADPIHHLAGGRQSGVGNGLSTAGVGVFQAGAQSGNGYMMLAGAGLKILGGLTNAMFGIKEDKAKKQMADQNIRANNNFMSNATSFDAIQGPAAMSNTDVYEGGWFSGGAADDKNEALAKQMAEAYSWADRSVLNNISNISSDQMSNMLRNYSAFGGYLTRPKRRRKVKR